MVMVPYVNLNGTSREELIQQQMTALKAIKAAIEALNQANPHGRDYMNMEDYRIAREEQVQRAIALRDIKQEIETVIYALME